MPNAEHDAFISHASEDKKAFVEPLAKQLIALGLSVWYDAFSLKVGDSLHESIERGLSGSKYGVVIFSPAFFQKNWPRSELNALFARQMNGPKVILPVWHNVTAADMLERYPILADIVALNSATGFEKVARSLVEEIKPELLTVSESLKAASLAGNRLANAVSERYPGYGIRIISGGGVFDNLAPAPDAIASVFQEDVRMDISVTNPSEIPGGRPQFNFTVSDMGAEKMHEAIKTGRAQELLSGEFDSVQTNIPFMIPDEEILAGTMTIRPGVTSDPLFDVRLEVGDGDVHHVAPIMRLFAVRAGTEEVEFQLSHPSQPFTVNIDLGVDNKRGGINMHASFRGFTFTTINNCSQLIQRIIAGEDVQIFDLANGQKMFGIRAGSTTPWIPLGLATLIRKVADIEAYFNLEIRWPNKITDEDVTKIGILHSLITGHEVGTNFRSTLSLPNTAQLREQFETWKKNAVMIFIAPTQTTDVSPLFGVDIPLRPWGYFTEQTVIENLQAVEDSLGKAKEGDSIKLDIRGVTPTFVRFN